MSLHTTGGKCGWQARAIGVGGRKFALEGRQRNRQVQMAEGSMRGAGEVGR